VTSHQVSLHICPAADFGPMFLLLKTDDLQMLDLIMDVNTEASDENASEKTGLGHRPSVDDCDHIFNVKTEL